MATRVYATNRGYYGDRIVSHVSQILWFVLTIIEVLLLFRFFLKLIGAGSAGFAGLIYDMTAPLIQPFQYIIGNSVSSGSIVEWSSIIAIIAYWILAWIIIAIVDMARPMPRERIEHIREEY